MLRITALAATAAMAAAADSSPSSSAGPYYVHALSAKSKRVAAWSRTKCGSYNRNSDIPTQWGSTVSPNPPPLQEYPRPQMVRDASTYTNLNGLWEFQLGNGPNEPVPFGQTLNQTILVPYPLESCLSGAFMFPTYSKYMWYRYLVDAPSTAAGVSTLLHFGAVDWNSSFYVNGHMVANHIGGYDGITLDVTSYLQAQNNEIIVQVYDPSDEGYQPHGKQRISAITSPGGDTYTPSSGIWQTVWFETVPTNLYIAGLRVRGDMQNIYLTVLTEPRNVPASVTVGVSFQGQAVTSANGDSQTEIVIPIANAKLWGPLQPNLYDLNITVMEPSTGNMDTATSYVGMRSVSLLTYTTPPVPPSGPRPGWDNAGGDMPGSPFTLPQPDYNLCWAACNKTAGCLGWSYGVPSCGGDPAQPQCWLKASPGSWGTNQCRVAGDMGSPGGPGRRPGINGQFTYLSGMLDQSWWPDGQYTAPTDDALRSDLALTAALGFNSLRLHQKVNSERWYYHADTIGIVIMHDFVQKYGGASAATIPVFLNDAKAAMDGRGNHPCIVQWEVFNEGDCVGVFPNVTEVVEWVQAYDPYRLVDTNSGGPANGLHIGNVNDIHTYPNPGNPIPSATQYAMVGEFAGIGAFVPGHEWVPNGCYAYESFSDPANQASAYVNMTKTLLSNRGQVSVSIATQVTDLEEECDGFVNYDRTAKFTSDEIAAIYAANQALIAGN